MRVSYFGYDAIDKRKQLQGKSEEKYLEDLEDINDGLEIVSYKNVNLDDRDNPLREEFEIISEGDGAIGDKFYLNPFLFDRLEENPFKLEERLYPVDFGYPSSNEILVSLNIPEGYEVASSPKNKSMALPQKKGYFMFSSAIKNRKINISYKFVLNNSYFYNTEYRYLKALFREMIKTQTEPIVLKRIEASGE